MWNWILFLLINFFSDYDSDVEWDNPDIDYSKADEYPALGAIGIIGGSSEVVDEYPEISGVTTAREAMKKMPEEDRAKIQEQVEVFRVEKRKFDIEVSKWDDNGNDIIVLAKHMCMIMMEMTDFTRGIYYCSNFTGENNNELYSISSTISNFPSLLGKGPLQTTLAVITSAKKISEAGTKLDKLARQIADQCPESSTKKDLLAYLQRIALYCHQLNITSKVKADVQNVSGELIGKRKKHHAWKKYDQFAAFEEVCNFTKKNPMKNN